MADARVVLTEEQRIRLTEIMEAACGKEVRCIPDGRMDPRDRHFLDEQLKPYGLRADPDCVIMQANPVLNLIPIGPDPEPQQRKPYERINMIPGLLLALVEAAYQEGAENALDDSYPNSGPRFRDTKAHQLAHAITSSPTERIEWQRLADIPVDGEHPAARAGVAGLNALVDSLKETAAGWTRGEGQDR
jgi:hypothetical protein